MTTPNEVPLQAILEGMEFQSDEMQFYVHRPTGRVVAISDEAMHTAEEGENAVLGVEPEELAEARGLLAAPDDYLPLPDRYEIDEYRMMEAFAAGVESSALRTALLDALVGRGAFRRFKDMVKERALAERWYAFRGQGYERVAREWCAAHGIAVAGSD